MKKFLFFVAVFMLVLSVDAQQQFTNFASKNTITSLADDGTKMWIGTSGGLYVRNKATGAIMLTYTIDNGLPSNFVNDVIVDPFSNVWVATRKGLAKFDGSSWTVYDQSSGLPNNLINGVTVDQSGNIWVYSFWKHLSKLESNDTWTNYSSSEGFPSEQPLCIATGPAGNIWIGTYGGGVYDFNISSETFTQHDGHFGSYDRVYDIIVDANSNMWFAAYGGLVKYNFSTWELYTTADGLAQNISKSLVSDPSGYIWVGSSSQGVTKFDPTGMSTVVYNEGNGLGHNYVDALAIDTDGKIWVGTQYGLNRYNVSGDSWNEYIVSNSLSNNEVEDIKVDALGNIWVGTEYGLNRYNGTIWTNWFQEDGLIQDRVTCLDVSGTDVWTGSNYGLSHYDGSSFATYGLGNGITQVKDVLINTDGSVWAATNSGLVHFDGTTTTTYTTSDGLVNNYCQSLAKDGSGNLWIGTNGGVSVWNGSVFTNYTTADGLSQNSIHGIFVDDNDNIWVMCQAQVTVWDGSAWTQVGFNTTYNMAKDANGNYWFANYWGAKKFDGTNTVTYTSDDGMADDVVYEVAIDASGTKWLGTYAGLIKAECENPIPSFSSNIACLPGTTTFTNTSTDVDATTTYEWDINNDGSVEYTTFEPSHEFNAEGTYSVKLTAYNDDCSEELIQDVVVYNTPEVILMPSGTINVCNGSSAEITAYGYNFALIGTEDFSYSDLATSGWTNGGDATTNWSIQTTNNAGGTASELRMSYNPDYDGLGWVASQVYDLSAYGDLNIQFKHSVNHYSNSYTIGMKTSSDGTTWSTVWSQFVDGDMTATTESINISNSDVGSSTFQIAFYLEGNSFDIDYWYIDDIELYGKVLGAVDPAYTLAWSTGADTESITVSDADDYTLTVTNNTCTYEPAAVTVQVVDPIDVSICMVTVDTSLSNQKNLIVWEKPVTTAIDYFNIYKEMGTDVYQIIGSKPYNEISEFIDYTSNPTVHADKYKISVVDTCGNESDLSPYHQTMNLSQAQGGEADELVLLWNKYEDESGVYTPLTYDVYRGMNAASMELESAVTGGLSSFNYNALNVSDGEQFIVVIDMPTCTPTTQMRATGGPYYQSTSNLEDEGIIDVNTKLNLLESQQWSIYPNPVSDKSLVKSDELIETINIYSIKGDIVRQYSDINALEFEILKGDLKSGTYILELNGLNKKSLIIK
jgi:ligand-binding sensor domain-containing protein